MYVPLCACVSRLAVCDFGRLRACSSAFVHGVLVGSDGSVRGWSTTDGKIPRTVVTSRSCGSPLNDTCALLSLKHDVAIPEAIRHHMVYAGYIRMMACPLTCRRGSFAATSPLVIFALSLQNVLLLALLLAWYRGINGGATSFDPDPSFIAGDPSFILHICES